MITIHGITQQGMAWFYLFGKYQFNPTPLSCFRKISAKALSF
jgi:hypothetical protein